METATATVIGVVFELHTEPHSGRVIFSVAVKPNYFWQDLSIIQLWADPSIADDFKALLRFARPSPFTHTPTWLQFTYDIEWGELQTAGIYLPE